MVFFVCSLFFYFFILFYFFLLVFETLALRPNLWSDILYNKRIKIKYLLGLKIKIMKWWIKCEKRRWNMATCTKKYDLMNTQRQSCARKMFIWDQAHHIKFLMRAQFRSCVHWENVLNYTITRLYFLSLLSLCEVFKLFPKVFTEWDT